MVWNNKETKKKGKLGEVGILLAAFFVCFCMSVIGMEPVDRKIGVNSIELAGKNGWEIGSPLPIIQAGNNLSAPVKPSIELPAMTTAIPEDKRSIYEVPAIERYDNDNVYDTEEIVSVSASTENFGAEIPSTPAIMLRCEGELRMDYCIGSQVDISMLKIYARQDGRECQIPLEECQVGNIDTTVAGVKTLAVTYEGESAGIPYGVVPYTVSFDGNGGTIFETEAQLLNYCLNIEEIPVPRKPGKEFSGWYIDKECTILFTAAAPGEHNLVLYAGFKDFDKFLCDGLGNIIHYTGTWDDIREGFLVLPHHIDCTGIASGAFDNVGPGIMEIYIPENITYIEPSAFDVLADLFYVEVSPDNPNYRSEFGVVYTKDGSEIVVFPKGRENLDLL